MTRTRTTMIAALTIVAGLTLAGGLLVDQMINSQATAGDEINIAGRQRMLSQRIALYGVDVDTTVGTADQVVLAERLGVLARELADNHHDLRSGAPERHLSGDLPADAIAVLDEAPYRVGARLTELVTLALDVSRRPPAVDHDPRMARIAEISRDADPYGLPAGLDTVVRVLADADRGATGNALTLTRVTMLLVIVALFAIWLLAFHPLIERLRQTILELDESRRRLDDQAHRDELTGLPNRRGLERIIRLFGGADVALCMIDLDGFKEVNDTLGHPAGDSLLLQIAERIGGFLGTGEAAARLGGDEFALLLTVDTDERLVERAGLLLTEIAQPVELGGTLAAVTASIGLHVGPSSDATALVRDADTALYAAKEAGRARVVRFEHHMREVRLHDFQLSNELQRALDTNELVNHYQPLIDLQTGRAASVETLIRWAHPRLGMVPPDRFLTLVRRNSELLEAMTRGVLKRAVRDIALLRSDGHALTVSVNVPGRLMNSWIVDEIERQLERSGLPGEALEVEVTEHELVLSDVDTTLERLRELGVRVSIDDFGTGYCSLARLHNLAVDHLKLDRQFVQSIDGRGGSIARAVMSMAHELELDVVAEGIETVAQRDEMTALGARYGQGWLWSKALPLAELTDYLRRPVETVIVTEER